MKSILFTIATLVACSSRVSAAPAANSTAAPPPQGTYGHTVVVANNTVFIQGGSTSTGLSKASYAIILSKDGSLNNATWQDTTKLSAFTPRNFGVAAATNNVMITCGTDDGAKASISCDKFDVIWYNKTTAETAGIPNRAGMAVAYSAKNNKAYFVGGYGNNNIPVATVTVATLPTSNSADLQLDKGTDITGVPRRFHTATWIDALNGFIVLGGQTSNDIVLPFNPALIFDAAASTWSSQPLNLPPTFGDPTRYGHSAVSDGNGNIFVFGGFDNQGNIQSDMLLLDTKPPRANWAFQALAKAPEGRAFHTATLLPDNTILIMWGQNGKGPATAQSTFMVFDIGLYVWTTGKPQGFPTMITTTESPNTPKPVPNDPPVVKPNPNGPNDPPQSNNPDKGISGSGSGGSVNIPLIAGLCAAGVVLLFLIIVLILLIRRRNRRNRPIPTYHPTMMGKGDMAMASPPYEEEDKAKQATAFMIRRPPSVYMVDDQGADYDVNPNSKSQYYGERDTGRESSVAEYELHGAGRNTHSTVSSVAERRRYVEEQQRQFREGYENAYHHPPPFASNSRDDRDYDDDDEPSSARRTDSSTGPRYPRAETSRRGQASTYDHPANDYFAA